MSIHERHRRKTKGQKTEEQRRLDRERGYEEQLINGVFEIVPFDEGPDVFIYNRKMCVTGGVTVRHLLVRECINPDTGFTSSSDTMCGVNPALLAWIRERIGWKKSLQDQWRENRDTCDLGHVDITPQQGVVEMS